MRTCNSSCQRCFKLSTKKLNALHVQFRELATRYNLTVKELHSHFSERKTIAVLYRLEAATKEMSAIARQVIALSKDTGSRWNLLGDSTRTP